MGNCCSSRHVVGSSDDYDSCKLENSSKSFKRFSRKRIEAIKKANKARLQNVIDKFSSIHHHARSAHSISLDDDSPQAEKHASDKKPIADGTGNPITSLTENVISSNLTDKTQAETVSNVQVPNSHSGPNSSETRSGTNNVDSLDSPNQRICNGQHVPKESNGMASPKVPVGQSLANGKVTSPKPPLSPSVKDSRSVSSNSPRGSPKASLTSSPRDSKPSSSDSPRGSPKHPSSSSPKGSAKTSSSSPRDSPKPPLSSSPRDSPKPPLGVSPRDKLLNVPPKDAKSHLWSPRDGKPPLSPRDFLSSNVVMRTVQHSLLSPKDAMFSQSRYSHSHDGHNRVLSSSSDKFSPSSSSPHSREGTLLHDVKHLSPKERVEKLSNVFREIQHQKTDSSSDVYYDDMETLEDDEVEKMVGKAVRMLNRGNHHGISAKEGAISAKLLGRIKEEDEEDLEKSKELAKKNKVQRAEEVKEKQSKKHSKYQIDISLRLPFSFQGSKEDGHDSVVSSSEDEHRKAQLPNNVRVIRERSKFFFFPTLRSPIALRNRSNSWGGEKDEKKLEDHFSSPSPNSLKSLYNFYRGRSTTWEGVIDLDLKEPPSSDSSGNFSDYSAKKREEAKAKRTSMLKSAVFGSTKAKKSVDMKTDSSVSTPSKHHTRSSSWDGGVDTRWSLYQNDKVTPETEKNDDCEEKNEQVVEKESRDGLLAESAHANPKSRTSASSNFKQEAEKSPEKESREKPCEKNEGRRDSIDISLTVDTSDALLLQTGLMKDENSQPENIIIHVRDVDYLDDAEDASAKDNEADVDDDDINLPKHSNESSKSKRQLRQRVRGKSWGGEGDVKITVKYQLNSEFNSSTSDHSPARSKSHRRTQRKSWGGENDIQITVKNQLGGGFDSSLKIETSPRLSAAHRKVRKSSWGGEKDEEFRSPRTTRKPASFVDLPSPNAAKKASAKYPLSDDCRIVECCKPTENCKAVLESHAVDGVDGSADPEKSPMHSPSRPLHTRRRTWGGAIDNNNTGEILNEFMANTVTSVSADNSPSCNPLNHHDQSDGINLTPSRSSIDSNRMSLRERRKNKSWGGNSSGSSPITDLPELVVPTRSTRKKQNVILYDNESQISNDSAKSHNTDDSYAKSVCYKSQHNSPGISTFYSSNNSDNASPRPNSIVLSSPSATAFLPKPRSPSASAFVNKLHSSAVAISTNPNSPSASVVAAAAAFLANPSSFTADALMPSSPGSAGASEFPQSCSLPPSPSCLSSLTSASSSLSSSQYVSAFANLQTSSQNMKSLNPFVPANPSSSLSLHMLRPSASRSRKANNRSRSWGGVLDDKNRLNHNNYQNFNIHPLSSVS